MKRLNQQINLFIFIVLFLSGCKTNVPKPIYSQPIPNKVDGLKLTFINLNFPGLFYPTSIDFVNVDTGFIGGYDGAIYKTTDGGNSWKTLKTNTLQNIYDICFLNGQEGFAVGGGTYDASNGSVSGSAPLFLQTLDGGQTWHQLPINSSLNTALRSVYFVDDSVGYAVGMGLILSTKDGGATWKNTKINYLKGILLDVKFINKDIGLIASTSGDILRTLDGGAHWNISGSFPATSVNSISLINQNLFYAASSANIVKSETTGSTWETLPSYPSSILKLIFTTPETGFAFGLYSYSSGDSGMSNGTIYYTTNGGVTWIGSKWITATGLIEAASFPSEDTGYAIGWKGETVLIKITKQ